MVDLRRRLHAEPEVGLELPRTREKVLAALRGLGLEIRTGESLSSVTAVLRGGGRGPCVLLRGDMDALPVTERTGLDYAATNGAMHACGHDLHTAMLVAAARLLAARRDELVGDVVFMFQPGEESGWDGASHMIEEGVLEAAGAPPVAAYGLHVASGLYPRGTFVTRPGPWMAASDRLTVTVRGAGGHGSSPYLAKDPIPATCEIVTALQTMLTRTFDPFDPVVLTVGSLHAGSRHNVIPEAARFEATVRSFSEQSRARLRETTTGLIHSIAEGYGLTAEVDYAEEYPVTANDDAETAFAEHVVAEVVGDEHFVRAENPMMGSEDFSRVLERVPGCFLWLGACAENTDPASAAMNHSPLAVFDEAVMPEGVALLVELAERRLAAAAGAA
ncbi:amidohydrolase [Actinopolyspora mortivallis]|uniref:Amidohydrolase n=2 Tax=Actinopolyspora mortivallis TaxID=33906 RepID=A0A2T0GUR1_ACTMO|nr:amidohydrolase [Actinopolyspora mortivallis]